MKKTPSGREGRPEAEPERRHAAEEKRKWT
jgi:hypothetical protein